MDRVRLSIGEVAARTGLPISTLHFYERKGLIAPLRDSANNRSYPREILRRITIIKVAQRSGVPLSEIADALSNLPNGRTPTAKDWARLSKAWNAGLTERINALTALRDKMSHCIGCGCLSVKACPLANENDHLATRGAGAHLL